MRKHLSALLLLLSFVLVEQSFSQSDSLYLMSGKNLAFQLDSTNSKYVFGSINGKSTSILKDKIYAYSLNREKYYVYPDRSIDFLSVPQMGKFIYGKQIAKKNYSISGQVITGFALGLIGSLYDTYETNTGKLFNREPSYGMFVAPMAYTLSINIFRPELKKKHISNPSYLMNELIIDGFQAESRRRKFLATSISSLSGTFVGLAGYFIFKP